MRAAIPLLLVLSACAAPAESEPERSPSAADEGRTAPGSSLVPASEQPTRDGGDVSITGVLGFDAIEGGCGYVETADGTRYEVVWPRAWELRSYELRSPDGTVVARVGDEVTVHGSEAEDRASICQIGPIFQASAVEG